MFKTKASVNLSILWIKWSKMYCYIGWPTQLYLKYLYSMSVTLSIWIQYFVLMSKHLPASLMQRLSPMIIKLWENDLIVGGVVYNDMQWFISGRHQNQYLDTWEDAAIIRSWSASFADPENMTRLVIIHILSVGEF